MIKSIKLYTAIVLSMIFWSFSFIWTRVAIQSFPPMTLIMLRLFIASVLLYTVTKVSGKFQRLRGKDISPCRLLFLDEAARLDAKSITTLFELCERLDMQLIIAAPENISPEKGTTYKLVRKVFQNSEHVHVVGLRGFAPQPPESLPETTADAS